MATSYANGGQLSASNSEAWNSWHNVKTGLKSLINRKHSSLIINPFPNITKLAWLYKFIYNINYKIHPSTGISLNGELAPNNNPLPS